ncbi:MAG TPA: molybdopterin-dependent oxidoreductase [Candidatus Dormibacteraeota bacterium]|nr:molybdopterin-dependent oxidoreductase [Candidatus Dormibacteraeota bacterium]
MTAEVPARQTVRTMCPMNCMPTQCGMLVELEGDRVVRVRGDRDNPESHGFLCPRGRAAGEIVDNPRRILTPMGREAPGRPWSPVSWDVALDRLAGAIREAGPGATAVWPGHGVFISTLGGQIARRFTYQLGAQWWHPSIVCWGLGGLGFWLTGVTEVHTGEDLADNADLVLLWGANLASQPLTGPHLAAARRRGAHVVAIDVRVNEAFGVATEGILVRPGTDAALALAMAHVIVEEGLHDRDFVERHTAGFEEFRRHVHPLTPAWAEGETGVPAERIIALARRLASTPRSMILAGGSSMHKSGNSWHAARAISSLLGLTGAVGRPGAGMGPRHGASPHGMGLGSIGVPQPASTSMVSEMESILDELERGRIEVILLPGSNFVSGFASSRRVERALSRMRMVASFDLFPNETTEGFAHLSLPGTSWLEETGCKVTNTNVHLMDRMLAPRGESRPLWWLLDQLGGRLGLPELLPGGSAESALDRILDHDATGHVTIAELREGSGNVPLRVSPVAHPDLEFDTPSGRLEFVSERAVELGLPSLPVYEPPVENHVRALAARRFPLVLTYGRTLTHFHSFYDHGRALPSLARIDPEPRLWLNLEDAAARGVVDGARIRIHNDRGDMIAVAQVTDRVPPGVVWMHDGYEGLNRLSSGARTVTDAAAKAFPAGSASYEARVQVEAV